jgi:hypothetical protein
MMGSITFRRTGRVQGKLSVDYVRRVVQAFDAVSFFFAQRRVWRVGRNGLRFTRHGRAASDNNHSY